MVTLDDRPPEHVQGTTLVRPLLPRTGRSARRGGWVKGARRASRSDGEAALDAAISTWTMTRPRELAHNTSKLRDSCSSQLTWGRTWGKAEDETTGDHQTVVCRRLSSPLEPVARSYRPTEARARPGACPHCRHRPRRRTHHHRRLPRRRTPHLPPDHRPTGPQLESPETPHTLSFLARTSRIR